MMLNLVEYFLKWIRVIIFSTCPVANAVIGRNSMNFNGLKIENLHFL